MQITKALVGLLGLAIVADCAALNPRRTAVLAGRLNKRNDNNGGNGGNNGGNNEGNNEGNKGGPQLNPANIQDASNNDGQPDQNAGQSPSATFVTQLVSDALC